MAQVSAATLVHAWQTSDSVKEVEEKTGLKYANIMTRMSVLRKRMIDEKGVDPFKKMERAGGGGRKLDLDELQRLCLIEC